MKIKFLVQGKVASDEKCNIICQGHFFKNLTISADTIDDGVEVMKLVLEQFMKNHGLRWIEKWKGAPGFVNCPDAYIQLPSDIWKCKSTKEACAIQAQIPIKDKTIFFAGCSARHDRKENIYRIIQDKKYTGFHHIPGRYLCVQCEKEKCKKVNEHYHYPWEMVSISDCINYSGMFETEGTASGEILDYEESLVFDEQLKNKGYLTLQEILEKEGFEPSAAGYGVCPECCVKILSSIFSEIKGLIRVVEINFYKR